MILISRQTIKETKYNDKTIIISLLRTPTIKEQKKLFKNKSIVLEF